MHMSPCRDSVIAGMMGMGSIIHPVVDFTEAACLSPNPTSEWITNLLQAITIVLIWHWHGCGTTHTVLLLLITINQKKKDVQNTANVTRRLRSNNVAAAAAAAAQVKPPRFTF